MGYISNIIARSKEVPRGVVINKISNTITHQESGSRIIALTADQYTGEVYAKKFHQIIFDEPDMFHAEDEETLNNFVNRLRFDLDTKNSSRLIAIGTPLPPGLKQVDLRTMENMKKKLCVNQKIPAIYF